VTGRKDVVGQEELVYSKTRDKGNGVRITNQKSKKGE
jgi:hypothetical protein